jgi:hypothetical protein
LTLQSIFSADVFFSIVFVPHNTCINRLVTRITDVSEKLPTEPGGGLCIARLNKEYHIAIPWLWKEEEDKAGKVNAQADHGNVPLLPTFDAFLLLFLQNFVTLYYPVLWTCSLTPKDLFKKGKRGKYLDLRDMK